MGILGNNGVNLGNFKEYDMKNVFKIFGLIAFIVVIGFSIVACDNITRDNGTKGEGEEEDNITSSIDTTALDAVIHEAWSARDGVERASIASEMPTGKKWVTESEWNAFNGVYKTAVETKVNPLSQSSVDTAKTNLQAALANFNTAKKNGSGPAITLSGTITIKNNGQTVPYVEIWAHTNNWSWGGGSAKIPSTAANSPWSIITKPFSSPTDIVFTIQGYENDINDPIFYYTVDGFKETVYNTDVTDITINLENLKLITISGTLNLDYNGKKIPSMVMSIDRKADGLGLGRVYFNNVRNSVLWSVMIEAQDSNTDVFFQICGFDGPIPWEDDLLFNLWEQGFGVKVGNQNISGIALNCITVSGTVNVTYKGNPVPFVSISIQKEGEDGWYLWQALNSTSADTPWSFVIPAYTSHTGVSFGVAGKDENGEELFSTSNVTTITVKDINVSGIALNLITLSGTINVTYKGNQIPIVGLHFDKKVGNNNYEWVCGKTLNSPSANAPWTVYIPAYTSNTEIVIGVSGYQDEDTRLFFTHGVPSSVTVKNTDVSGIAIYVGNITN